MDVKQLDSIVTFCIDLPVFLFIIVFSFVSYN